MDQVDGHHLGDKLHIHGVRPARSFEHFAVDLVFGRLARQRRQYLAVLARADGAGEQYRRARGRPQEGQRVRRIIQCEYLFALAALVRFLSAERVRDLLLAVACLLAAALFRVEALAIGLLLPVFPGKVSTVRSFST